MKLLVTLLMTLSLFTVGCANMGKRSYKQKGGQCMMKADADKDGVITKEEFEKHHADKWTAMDADKDGKVTKEEKKAYKKDNCSKKEKKKKGCDKC